MIGWLRSVLRKKQQSPETESFISRPYHRSLPEGSALKAIADKYDREYPASPGELEMLERMAHYRGKYQGSGGRRRRKAERKQINRSAQVKGEQKKPFFPVSQCSRVI